MDGWMDWLKREIDIQEKKVRQKNLREAMRAGAGAGAGGAPSLVMEERIAASMVAMIAGAGAVTTVVVVVVVVMIGSFLRKLLYTYNNPYRFGSVKAYSEVLLGRRKSGGS